MFKRFVTGFINKSSICYVENIWCQCQRCESTMKEMVQFVENIMTEKSTTFVDKMENVLVGIEKF